MIVIVLVLDCLPSTFSLFFFNGPQELYKTFISFEKSHGDRDAIEDVIVGKRRFQYEEELKQAPKNYDIWFDYARLEEAYGMDFILLKKCLLCVRVCE